MTSGNAVRHSFIALLASRALALGCLGVAWPATTAPATEKPNIVFILADDLGFGDVHCLNPTRGRIPTPHLDKLASQGMTFTDAHSGSSVCTPTRYGVLTGRYAWRSRLQSGVLPDNRDPLIVDGRLTVGRLLKDNGYATACIGKWHVGFSLEGVPQGKLTEHGAPLGSITHNGPLTRGFDEFFGFDRLTAAPTSMFEGDRCTRLIEPVELLAEFARRAGAFVENAATSGKPFFLYLPLNSPHTPIVPSEQWWGKSGLGDYGDFVMETDWAVGQVLAALDKAGVAENTLVIFTADNGCSKAANIRQLEAKGHHSSAHFRGSKSDIWEGGHRVPFLTRWPAAIKPGTTSGQTICLTDFMATCAEILGVTLPETSAEDSVSILPALLGGDRAPLREAVVHHSISGVFSIRQGPWKLCLGPGSGGWTAPTDVTAIEQKLPGTQLYNLADDPGETRNLQADEPEIVARLTALLERYVAEGRSTPGARQANEVPVVLRRAAKPKREEE